MSKTRCIEITFPEPVEMIDADYRALDAIVSEICKRYETANPGRVMWPFGMGSRIVSMPMTAEDDAAGVPMVFDDTVYAVECSERADYGWPCAKCGVTQGDHKTCITEPPAGNCDFEPLDPVTLAARRKRAFGR